MLDPDNILSRKLDTFVQLSQRERRRLGELLVSPVRVKRGEEMVHEGQTGHVAYILWAGWACSYKELPDGGRQIIRFPVPGDFIGLRSILLRRSAHSFSALTDVTVTRVEASRIMAIFEEAPRVGMAILWAASRDEAMVVEHLVSIGRRDALERTGHFFLELCERLQMVGLATQSEFDCPLNQYALADALGLSAIHVNRVLRQLRERNLMTLRRNRCVIHNAAALKQLTGFESLEPDGRRFRDLDAVITHASNICAAVEDRLDLAE